MIKIGTRTLFRRAALAMTVVAAIAAVALAADVQRIADIKSPYFDQAGAQKNISALTGQVVLVNFWAEWCAPCLAEIPTLNELHQRFGTRGLTIVGINVDVASPEELKKLVDKLRMRYGVGFAKMDLSTELGIQAIPVSLLFGTDGTLLRRYTGAPPAPILTQDVEKAMAGK